MKASQVTPDLISKVNDVKNLKAIALGLITYRDKLTTIRDELKIGYHTLETQNNDLKTTLNCENEKSRSMSEMIQDLMAKKEGYEMQISDLRRLIQSEEGSALKIQDLNNENENLKNENEKLNSQLISQKEFYEQNIKDLKALKDDKTKEENENEIKNVLNENEKLKTKISFLQNVIDTNESNFSETKNQLEIANKKIIKLEEQNKENQLLIQSLNEDISQHSTFSNREAELQSSNELLTKSLSESQNSISQLQDKLNDINSKYQELLNKSIKNESQENEIDDNSLKSKTELDNQKQIFDSEISNIQAKNLELQSQISSLTSENSQLLAQLETFNNSNFQEQISILKNKEGEYIQKISELQDQIQKQNNQDFSSIKIKFTRLESELAQEKEFCKNKDKEIQELKSNNAQLKQITIEKEETESLQTKELINATNQFKVINKSLEEANEKNMNLEKELVSKSQMLQKKSDELEKLKSQLNESENNCKKFTESLQQSEAAINLLKTKIQNLENSKTSLLKQLDDISLKLGKSEANSKMISNTLDIKVSQIQKLLAENSSLKEIKEEHDKLSNEYETLKNENCINLNRIKELLESVNNFRVTKESLEKELDDVKVNASIVPELNNVINSKDQTIAKYQVLIQRYVNEDKRKQELIDSYIKAQQEKEQEEHQDISPEMAGQIVRLQNEKLELQDRLEKSKPTREAELKLEKANAIIERSNALYSDLLRKNRELQEDQRIRKVKNSNRFSRYTTDLVNILPLVSMESEKNSTTLTPCLPEQTSKQKSSRNLQNDANFDVLKKVLLQFFLQEESRRNEIIPIILDLIGCKEDQIQKVIRQWERSKQLKSSSSFFGF